MHHSYLTAHWEIYISSHAEPRISLPFNLKTSDSVLCSLYFAYVQELIYKFAKVSPCVRPLSSKPVPQVQETIPKA